MALEEEMGKEKIKRALPLDPFISSPGCGCLSFQL